MTTSSMKSNSTQDMAALLQRLQERDIRVWVEGERLRFSLPKAQESYREPLKAELSTHKVALMVFLQSQQSPMLDKAILQPVDRNQELPLSFAQQRLWFLAQFDAQSTPYNESAGLMLIGELNVAALEQSLSELVRRHETLRTNFPQNNGIPFQCINPPGAITLPIVDLRGLSEAEQLATQQRMAAEDSQRPFDLAQDLLLRFQLLRRSDTTEGKPCYVLLSTMHHIISDMWSMSVFTRELSTLYQAYASGKPSPLPELTIQYADFAYWQRQWLTGEVLDRQLSYWKQTLKDAPALLELPTDFPRPPVQTFKGARLPVRLTDTQITALRALSQRSGASVFMILQSVFALLLAHYSGQTDIVTGSPIANRTQRQVEGLIGFFVNTLVVRTDVSGDISFNELLQRVRAQAIEAYSHQDIPFEKLVEELQPTRNLSYSPLFQVMFALRNIPGEDLDLAGLTIKPVERTGVVAKFDLTLELNENPKGIFGALEYNTDLFSPATIARMEQHLQQLLDTVLNAPDTKIQSLALLTEQERSQLQSWNNTKIAFPAKTLVQLFEEQVAKTPDAIAVVSGEQALSYQALNERANQLAHYLMAQGIKPEALVALCMERSVDMLVGLLGILKSGTAYLPLDPAFPPSRLAYIVENAQPALILTHYALQDSLPQTHTKTVLLDVETEGLNLLPQHNPAPMAQLEHLAYTIYTSGSTGQPKGVQIEHKALINLLHAMQLELELQPQDAWLAVTTLSFDIAALEIFLPLLVGAKTVLLPREFAVDAEQLRHSLEQHAITIMQATPATWRLLLSHDWQGNSQLKMLCGGEGLPLELARKLLPKGAGLWNVYGPTETTIWSTICRITPEHLQQQRVPIGKPLANTQLYVLNDQQRMAPLGVVGELYIGGDGLARGYYGRDDLTAERFVSVMLSEHQSAVRLYKTGDKARFLSSVEVECLGRLDNQIKLRGFRIEPQEIEANLERYPAVQSAIVLLQNKTSEDQRLIAYLVANPHEFINTKGLRPYLREHLPDYMLPAQFIVLDTPPLTPNGKIDRLALQQQWAGEQAVNEEASFITPRNNREFKLAKLFEEVLGVYPIGVHDNFFDLGGHSFLAVKLVTRINQVFETQLPLATLFREATVAKLGALLDRSTNLIGWSSLVPIQRRGERRPFFCMHPAGGTVFRYTLFAHQMGYERPFYGLQGLGIEPGQIPHNSIAEMAAAYIEEIRTVQPHGPYVLSGWSLGGTTAYEMALQLEAAGEEVPLVILFDTPTPDGVSYETDQIKFLLERVPTQGVVLDRLDEFEGFEDKLTYIFEQMKRFNPIMDFDVAEGKRFLKVYQHHNRIMSEYYPAKTIKGHLLYLKAQEALLYDIHMGNPLHEWPKFTQGGFSFEYIPGHHFNILEAAEGKVMAEVINRYLQQLNL
ncbi:MAG: amino acid adenylation domain-containing protein [Thiofilum sp.]|uniref:non-ribosomal peptide synthetase n=1 Tax=Thiofilum sp. TaxID=2212733 RepID=UPI0025D7EB4B|nr:amino acid adenylation domain-containing protein [Thiofilum sp.]MBK8452744.1 amino acid adenylation domain-containing protein [Thiofilum sp.]